MSIFRRKEKQYITPGGSVLKLSEAVLSAEHTLIAGATGSGKSVLLNAIIRDLLKTCGPAEAELVLIDPKMGELSDYRELPHTIGFAEGVEEAEDVLRSVVDLMARRNVYRRERGQRFYPGAAVYVIIDELYPLTMGANKREMSRLLALLLTQARASNIHVIACTQLPNRACIGAIASQFTMRIGLGTTDAIESRQVIGTGGCEELPAHGLALVKKDRMLHAVNIPMTDYDEVRELVRYWTSKRCIA